MDARTAFDREPGRTRRRAAVVRVPLRERTWFRVGGLVVGAGWVIACAYVALRLTA